MGYRGKVELQAKARSMRAESRTLQDIATTLGVSKVSVSVWVRDVPVEPRPRKSGGDRRPHPQHTAKLAEIDACDRSGVERIGVLTDESFLAAGTALYAEKARRAPSCSRT